MIPAREQHQLDQLNEDLEDFFRKISNYNDGQLNRQPDPAVWSPLMVAKHTLLAEGYAIRYIKKKLSFTDQLPKAGLRAKFRSAFLNWYLRSPLKWQAPKAISDDALAGPHRLEEIRQTWLDQRAQLAELLESLPAERYREELYKHPFVGKITATGMLAFFQEHFNRHRKQIERRLPA